MSAPLSVTDLRKQFSIGRPADAELLAQIADAERRRHAGALLPVAVSLVPLLDPACAQLLELLEVWQPHFHDLRIEPRGIDRRLLKRGENAQVLDHEGLTLFGQAPVEEQLGGVGI